MSLNNDENALNDYLSFEDESPFGEEFSKDDLVVSLSDEELKKKDDPFIDFNFEDPKPTIDYISEEDFEKRAEETDDDEGADSGEPKRLELEDIMNYSEDAHKKKSFKFDFGTSEENTPEEEKRQKDFRDIIEYRRISGKTRGLNQPNVIPTTNIVNKNDSVEIQDVHGFSPDEHAHTSQIITHLNDNGEISVIEVLCNCGNRTVIKLDYGKDEEEESTNLDEYYSQE